MSLSTAALRSVVGSGLPSHPAADRDQRRTPLIDLAPKDEADVAALLERCFGTRAIAAE